MNKQYYWVNAFQNKNCLELEQLNVDYKAPWKNIFQLSIKSNYNVKKTWKYSAYNDKLGEQLITY